MQLDHGSHHRVASAQSETPNRDISRRGSPSRIGSLLVLGAVLSVLAASPAWSRPLLDSDLPIELRDANIAATRQAQATRPASWTQVGEASYYRQSKHFYRTSSGERFNESAMTAAHHSLPLGTKVKVTNLSNGESVVVRINDRPADSNPRVIDLARGAARRLGMMQAGVAHVELSIMPESTPVEVAEVPENLDPPIKVHQGNSHAGNFRRVTHHSVAHRQIPNVPTSVAASTHQ
jgi:rare lipoprotein A